MDSYVVQAGEDVDMFSFPREEDVEKVYFMFRLGTVPTGCGRAGRPISRVYNMPVGIASPIFSGFPVPDVPPTVPQIANLRHTIGYSQSQRHPLARYRRVRRGGAGKDGASLLSFTIPMPVIEPGRQECPPHLQKRFLKVRAPTRDAPTHESACTPSSAVLPPRRRSNVLHDDVFVPKALAKMRKSEKPTAPSRSRSKRGS